MKRAERDALVSAIFDASDEKHSTAMFGAMDAAKSGRLGRRKQRELAIHYAVDASEAHGMVRAARVVQEWPVEDDPKERTNG